MYRKYKLNELSRGTSQELSEQATKYNERKVHTSSVVIIPPESCWDQIQAIRKEHDKQFERWMPHFNLVYPFMEDDHNGISFREAVKKLSAGLSQFKPFTVKLTKDSFGYFENNSYSTLWLKPLEENPKRMKFSEVEDLNGPITGTDEGKPGSFEPGSHNTEENGSNNDYDDILEINEEISQFGEDVFGSNPNEKKLTKRDSKLSKAEKKQLQKAKKKEAKKKNKETRHSSDLCHHPEVLSLQTRLETIYPYFNDQSQKSPAGFQPHLSVGQFKRQEAKGFMEKFKADWKDIEFEIDEICLISRKDSQDPFHIREKVKFGGVK